MPAPPARRRGAAADGGSQRQLGPGDHRIVLLAAPAARPRGPGRVVARREPAGVAGEALLLPRSPPSAGRLLRRARRRYSFPLMLGTVWAAFRLPAAAAVWLACWSAPSRSSRPSTGSVLRPRLAPTRARPSPRPSCDAGADHPGDLLRTDERHEATLRAQAAERRSDDRARLLEAVIAHLDEGVFVLASDGTLGVRNPAAQSVSATRTGWCRPATPPAAGGDGHVGRRFAALRRPAVSAGVRRRRGRRGALPAARPARPRPVCCRCP